MYLSCTMLRPKRRVYILLYALLETLVVVIWPIKQTKNTEINSLLNRITATPQILNLFRHSRESSSHGISKDPPVIPDYHHTIAHAKYIPHVLTGKSKVWSTVGSQWTAVFAGMSPYQIWILRSGWHFALFVTFLTSVCSVPSCIAFIFPICIHPFCTYNKY